MIMMMFAIVQKDWEKMFKDLNNQIQKQWAFFGPKWFCWLMVFLGLEIWIIEGIFKALGYAEYGPAFMLVEYTDLSLDTKNYILFAVLIVIISFTSLFAIIHFPSFMFLLTKIIMFKLIEKFSFYNQLTIYLIGFFIFTFPFWFNVYLYDIIKMFS